MEISQSRWRTIALVAVSVFALLATRKDVYNATSPNGLSRLLFGPGVPQFAHPWWLSLHVGLRKAYSIVAFAIVVFTAHRAMKPTARPGLRAALLGGTFSLAIEVAQRLFTAPEPLAESAFDVGCGAVGGWLAITAGRGIPLMVKRRNDAAPPAVTPTSTVANGQSFAAVGTVARNQNHLREEVSNRPT